MVELRNASLDLAVPLPVNAKFSIAGGQFHADGKLALAPLKGNFRPKLLVRAPAPYQPVRHARLTTAAPTSAARCR